MKPSTLNVRNQFNVSNRTQRDFVAVAYREAPVESPHGDGWLIAFAAIEKRSDSIATLAKHVERLRNTGRTGRGVSYLLFDSNTGQELDWSGKPKLDTLAGMRMPTTPAPTSAERWSIMTDTGNPMLREDIFTEAEAKAHVAANPTTANGTPQIAAPESVIRAASAQRKAIREHHDLACEQAQRREIARLVEGL